MLPAELADELANGDDLLRIEADGRLVEDQHLGVVQDRSGEPDALAVSLRERADHLPADVGEEAALERFAEPLAARAAIHPLEAGAVGEVLPDAHLGVAGDALRQVTQIAAHSDGVRGAAEEVAAT